MGEASNVYRIFREGKNAQGNIHTEILEDGEVILRCG
jgi:hypothetical protein